MKTSEKIKIVADAAKYDASCSSSGSSRKSVPDGIGNAGMSGICHSWAADGKCVVLLKKEQYKKSGFPFCGKPLFVENKVVGGLFHIKTP